MDKTLRLETTIGTSNVTTFYSDDPFHYVGWSTFTAILEPGMPIQTLSDQEVTKDWKVAVQNHLSMIQKEVERQSKT